MSRLRINGARSSKQKKSAMSWNTIQVIYFIVVFFVIALLMRQSFWISRKQVSANVSVTKTKTDGSSPSIFNCDGFNGLCKYFYPSYFFVPDTFQNNNLQQQLRGNESPKQNKIVSMNGGGSQFYEIYEELEDLRFNNSLWPQMPRIVLLEMTTKHLNTRNAKLNHHKVSYLHVHKAGGTSIHFQSRQEIFQVREHMVYHWPLDLLHHHTYIPTYKHIQSSKKFKSLPEKWKENEHILFSFIRDPLDRFISSIGQAMGAQGSESDASDALQEECIKDEEYSLENSRSTIQCCIDYIMEYGYFEELHFTPQAIELAFATQMYPIPVALFQYETSYKDVISELGMDPNKKMRDGNKDGMRPLPVLSEMTSADYTKAMKRQVCELYKVDVAMFRSLGWNTSSCDEFV